MCSNTLPKHPHENLDFYTIFTSFKLPLQDYLNKCILFSCALADFNYVILFLYECSLSIGQKF